MDFFNNLEAETSEEEHSQSNELEENLEEEQQTSEEEHSVEDAQEDVEEDSEEEENSEEEDDSEEETAPKYAGRFKNVEELERAYKELQGSYTKNNQKLNEVLGTMRKTQAPPTMPNQNTYQPVTGHIPQELANHPQFQQLQRDNPSEAQRVVYQYQVQRQQQSQQDAQQHHTNEQLKQVVLNQEILSMRTRHSDFDEVAADIPTTFQQNPWLWQAPSPVEQAYKLAKANRMDEVIATTQSAAKKEAAQSKKSKKSAVAEKQKAKVSKKKLTPEDEIANEIFEVRKGGNAFF